VGEPAPLTAATPDGLAVRRLAGDDLRGRLDALAAVLHDVVAGGASVSYLWPFSHADARAAFEAWAEDVDAGGRFLLGAFLGGELVGTVQVVRALPPNQPHRGDVAKLLVHRRARRGGVARALMERAEDEARADGLTLLVLDTVTGDPAEALYRGTGWNVVGTIPGYALYPDGRPCDTTLFWKAL
jgi:GNAT superfamily N-acetyltransferase